jgi:CheY-like chemotaxis protein
MHTAPVLSHRSIGPENEIDDRRAMILGAARPLAHDILLVEDEPEVRETLSQILKLEGYTTQVVAHGLAALDFLASNPTRLLITDIFMPEIDGFEFLMKLRVVSPRLPIIAMSGGFAGNSELFLNVARRLGAQHTLAKPFAMRDLLAAVQAAIGYAR